MKIANLKEKIIALIIVLTVVFFGYSIAGIYKDSSQKQINQLEEIAKEAKIQKQKAQAESDAATIRAKFLERSIMDLQKDMDTQVILLKEMNQHYRQTLSELNKYKNEKNYVPDNASYDEQSAFLSGYKYKSYEMFLTRPSF